MMDRSSLRAAWKPIALVAGGALVGGLIVWIAQPHGDDKAGSGTPVAAIPASAQSNAPAAQSQPESIDIGNARIPPPMPAAPIVTSPQPAQQMSWSGMAPGTQTPGSVQSIGVADRQIDYQTTSSGYPIITGRKAVDYNDPAQIGQGGPGTIDPGGWRTDGSGGSDTGPHLGPKGLIENPSVDPPSSHGAAYSRSY